jgi:hypothetical protein
MFNKDIFIKGFSIGLILNVVAAGIAWILIEQIGVSLIKNPMKLYLLAAIPAVFFMWYCIKKKGCVKIGMGALLSVIVFVGLFFYFLS